MKGLPRLLALSAAMMGPCTIRGDGHGSWLPASPFAQHASLGRLIQRCYAAALKKRPKSPQGAYREARPPPSRRPLDGSIVTRLSQTYEKFDC